MTEKFPAFQFYPGDWRKDTAVLSMSRHDRSVWLDLVCMMHDSPERGVLLLPNGRPMKEVDMCGNLGLSLSQTRKAVAAILDSGAGSQREDGAIYNRRMVKDEAIRKVRTQCGKMGGNPDLVKQVVEEEVNQIINQIPTPSIFPLQSSSSGEGNKKKKGNGEPSRKSAPPDELPVDAAMQDWLLDNGITCDFIAETEAMLDYFRGSGERKMDWKATWRTWMRNSKRFNRKGSTNGNRETHNEKDNRAVKDFITRSMAPEMQSDVPDVWKGPK